MRILAAAGGNVALRPVLLSLGSSSRHFRGLVLRLLPFRLRVMDDEVSQCRASFPKIARLTVKGDVYLANFKGPMPWPFKLPACVSCTLLTR